MRARTLLVLAASVSLALALLAPGVTAAAATDPAPESCPPTECFGWFGVPPKPVVNQSEMLEDMANDPLGRLPADAAWVQPAPRADRPPSVAVALGERVGTVTSPWHWSYSRTDPYGVCKPECVYVGEALTAAEISLNGRASRWRQTIQAFQGGRIRGRLWYNCVADNSVAPSTSCSDGWQFRENGQYTYDAFTVADQIFHQDADTYWYEFRFGVRPEEYPQYPSQGPEYSSFNFVCPRGNENCRF
ncbi:MAG: hypothetical protein M3O70_16450 [Actinomycetota bacterium]|nr:hypothetical protein [Actinomycetota bacterium]